MRKEKYRMSFKESAMIKFKANSLHILKHLSVKRQQCLAQVSTMLCHLKVDYI